MPEIPIETNFSGGLIAMATFLLVNGVPARAETALLSVRKTRLQNQLNKGDVHTGIILKLTENPNQFLPIIQISITSIDLLIGALTAAILGVWINMELERFSNSHYEHVAARRFWFSPKQSSITGDCFGLPPSQRHIENCWERFPSLAKHIK